MARGTCPACGAVTVAKCGEIVTWHWAHLASDDCDPWSEPETIWHRSWQSVVPPDQREVVIRPHRADIVTAAGWVIELQHSSLPVADIREREAFYGPRMAWIFDAVDAYEADRVYPRNRGDWVSFRWKHPRKSLVYCERPIYLDFGTSKLLRIAKIHPATPFSGWGHMVERAHIENVMRGDL